MDSRAFLHWVGMGWVLGSGMQAVKKSPGRVVEISMCLKIWVGSSGHWYFCPFVFKYQNLRSVTFRPCKDHQLGSQDILHWDRSRPRFSVKAMHKCRKWQKPHCTQSQVTSSDTWSTQPVGHENWIPEMARLVFSVFGRHWQGVIAFKSPFSFTS